MINNVQNEKILEIVEKIINDYHLCDSCFGRLFSKILNGKLKIRIDKLDMLLRVLNIYDKYKEELFNDFYLKQEQINEIEYFSLEDEIKDKKKDKLWKLSNVIW